MSKNILILSITSWFVFACQSVNSGRSGSSESYTEDLSAYRPVYPLPKDTLDNTFTTGNTTAPDIDHQGKPENDITTSLNTVLDEGDDFRKQVKYVDGFTIQVYSGTQSEDARKVRGKVLGLLPDENAKLIYEEPSFKVKVGRYYTRFEAQTSFAAIKEEFPSAIIIPERIPLSNDTD